MNNKKIIITEQQYRNLKFFILESTFFDMADKTIKKGDIITITTNSEKLNLKVIENFTGQIYMDNIDKGSDYLGKRVFLNKMSFDNNNLVIQVAKDEQKNEVPPKGNTWQKMTIKNIEDITVSRNGDLVDGLNHNPNDEINDKRKNDFIEMLLSLSDGESLALEINGDVGEIVLDYMNKSNGFIHFELSELTDNALGNVNITGVDISTNENDIEVSEDGLLTINVLTFESKDGSMAKKESKIQNIVEYSIMNTEDETEDNNDIENDEFGNGEESDIQNSRENTLDAKKIQQYLQNDEEFKKAFLNYKGKLSPSKWASFANELKDEKDPNNDGPKSSGLIKIKNIIHGYEDKKISEKFGDNFKKKSKIAFTPLEKVDIPYAAKGGEINFVLNPGEIYKDEMAVYYKGIDDTVISKGNFNLKLANNKFEIIIKNKTKTPNVYICDVVKLYKVKVKNEEDKNEIITRRTTPQKDVQIRFLNSEGYEAEETQTN